MPAMHSSTQDILVVILEKPWTISLTDLCNETCAFDHNYSRYVRPTHLCGERATPGYTDLNKNLKHYNKIYLKKTTHPQTFTSALHN